MANRILKFGFTAILAASFACMAQAPAGAPNGSTGQCKDGTYTSASHKSGACASHGGVQAWYGSHGKSSRKHGSESGQADATGNGRNTPGNYHGNTGRPAADEAPAGNRTDSAGNSGSAAKSSSASANANSINAHSGSAAVVTPNNGGETMAGPAARSGKSRANSRAGKEPAPGGGPDMVWVNSQSKVYHCYGSQFYGKTREGKYMTEQEAKKMGAKPDHGKPCSK